MHGENRVVEKLVHLHVTQVWNAQGTRKQERILDVEKVGMRMIR
jgi:hypothetical protein